jgi:arginase
MAMAALNGHGDPDVQELLPATVSPDRVALAGLHAWTEDDFPKVAGWGIASFSPGDLRETTRPLLDWLAATGCSRVAIHSTSTPSTAPGVRTPGTSALFTASGKPVG